MSLEFASKDRIWCVLFVEGGRLTSRVMFFSYSKIECIQYMEQRGYYLWLKYKKQEIM